MLLNLELNKTGNRVCFWFVNLKMFGFGLHSLDLGQYLLYSSRGWAFGS